MRRISSLAAFAVIQLAVTTAGAQTFYVREAATGAHDGTDWTNAYVALPDSMQRGGTYYVAAGTYGGHTFNDEESGEQWIVVRKATLADHGPAVGWQDAFAEQALFTEGLAFSRDYYDIDGAVRSEGDWTDTASYGFRINPGVNGYAIYIQSENNPPGADFLKIQYVDMGGEAGTAYPDVPGTGVYFFGLGSTRHDLTVRRCNIHNVGIPFHLINADTGLIEYNHVGPCWSKEAIRGMGSASHWIVRNNRFVDNGFYAGPTTGLTAEIAVWGNGEGPFDDWQIYGNVFWDTETGQSIAHNDGIILGGDTTVPSSNWNVYNNVFSGIAGHLASVSITGTNNAVFNNIWFDIASGTVIGCEATTCDNNWCFKVHPDDPNLPYGANCDLLKTDHPTTVVGASDPFVNSSGADYRLKDPALVTGASPVNAGKNPGAGYEAVDAYGNTRGADGTWDIGAYEYCVGTSCAVVPDAGPVKDSGASGSGGSGTAGAGAGGTGVDAGPDGSIPTARNGTSDDGGCGCRQTRQTGLPAGMAWVVALALMLGRRRSSARLC